MPAKLVFLVGCPRSGTTWLQLLLAQHPAVATLPETHIFPDYVSPLLAKHRGSDPARVVGLGAIVGAEEFRDLCRDLVTKVLARALEDKPAATVILEKTPLHLNYTQDILELFPDARFVHIVRDPRAVSASLLDAGRDWGKAWAPQTALDAARMWNRSMLHGLQLRRLAGACTEVRYEELVASPVDELQRLLRALGLSADRDRCVAAVAACATDNVRSERQGMWVPASMSGLVATTVRNAAPDGWRTELDGLQIETIEHVTRAMMQEFGFHPVRASANRMSLRLRARLAADRLQDLASYARRRLAGL